MIGKIAAFLLCIGCIQAASLRLENNSAYPLRAVIQGADGSVLSELSFEPQENKNWSDSNSLAIKKKSPSKSVTPFTVHWYCKGGESFSISDHVSTGAFVRAKDGVGANVCSDTKKDGES
ncbi:MAG: hypothetical protein JSS09_07405 [Verrucomicrobia bacterium]|nr:hypothetical protein [Verrucomicrobiota bacterium]